jgi:hypothetical protein
MECEGLILALAMIGAGLRGRPPQRWRYLLADLQWAKLRKVGVRPIGYGYESLYACIAASVNALDPVAKMKYLRVAVLLEDMAAPLPLLRASGEETRGT